MILEKVYDELYGMIEDLQKKIGKGGSAVTITPTLQSGDKVADYSIDGTEGAIYAPPNLDYYSSTEHVVGVWTDGREVFEKTEVVDATATANATIITVADADLVLITNAYGYSESAKQLMPVPNYFSATDRGLVYSVGNLIKSEMTSGFIGTYTKVLITYRYVKTASRTKTTKKK